MGCRFVLGSALLALAASSFARPDRNAFLNEAAGSTAGIIAQAKRDPEVMDRFRRHFRMSSAEVVDYISSLKLARLKKDGVYSVYSVPHGGWIKKHAQRYRQGTLVYVDSYGTPALVARCANPMNTGPKDNEDLAEDIDTTGRVEQELRDVGIDEVSAGSVEDLYLATPPDVAAAPIEPGPLTPNESAIPVIGAAPALGGWIIGLLGGGGLLIGGLDTDGGGDGDTAVPEPMTVAALGTGLALLARRRRR